MGEKEKMKIGIIERIFVAIAIVFFLIACMSMAEIKDQLEEQNKILKDAVIAMQVQNEILKFNPMED